MPVSDEYGVIFLHIPKAAGSSVVKALGIREGEGSFYSKDYVAGRIYALQHLPYDELRQAVGRRVWSSYAKFAIVRNPFDRLVSDYLWRKNGGLTDLTFDGFVDQAEARRGNYQGHFLPQTAFVGDDVEVLKFETLEKDWPLFAKRRKLPPSLPKENAVSQRGHYSSYYTLELKAKVERLYAADLRQFGYSFDGLPRRVGANTSFADLLGASFSPSSSSSSKRGREEEKEKPSRTSKEPSPSPPPRRQCQQTAPPNPPRSR
eukprot:CAMPEP_0118911796 /NCGR_PEP_ID=MMETSP1166-20130328/13336_1 /TAXON_ID=1104430 /ORGANISM="Chrysoreinhardia sp, Strain CCMP3193" /LENGTH=260 /DNA_ID=CAMNT_0006851303 /DNA_START=63 /DNA_END=841 /DNA_ORIENTATION=+